LHREAKTVITAELQEVPVEDKRTGLLRPGVYLELWKPKAATVHGDVELARLYDIKAEECIRQWIADDRAEAAAAWRAERERMHRGPGHIRQGRFDSIRREVFLAQQPDYYVVALGVDPLTFRPVAKVRIPSTYVYLFVDITPAVERLSRNKRRKAARYGKPLPQEIRETVETLAQKAVADWWSR